MSSRPVLALVAVVFLSAVLHASETKVLTNQLGYDPAGPKHAVILGKEGDSVSECSLKAYADDRSALTIPARAVGPVTKWRDWYFWTLDFDSFQTEGEYYVECASSNGPVHSYPFHIQQLLLERNTLSDVIYFFKEERSSGRFDQADRHLPFDGGKPGFVDAHGGIATIVLARHRRRRRWRRWMNKSLPWEPPNFR